MALHKACILALFLIKIYHMQRKSPKGMISFVLFVPFYTAANYKRDG